MTRLPLDHVEHAVETHGSARPVRSLGKRLIQAVRTFWRFSQFYGEYQSTPPWERHAKLAQMGNHAAQPSKPLQ
ncbi:MAG: hypothetical protein IGS54_25235 [Elainella sp. C42_A2020_010]|nr:hypothetical protein [Elainella sp. C42_A2020_010]